MWSKQSGLLSCSGLGDILDVQLYFGTMAGLSECVQWGAELQVRKMLQKAEIAAVCSLYLQKEKKGGFSVLLQSQERGTNKCKGRCQLRILFVGCVRVLFFICSFFFRCSQRKLLS